jgi:hydrogenase maturation protein HypF
MHLAAEAIRAGRIVAVKGLGGFHLFALASMPAAVAALRTRKGRAEKPFALMAPTMAHVESLCVTSAAEQRLLLSPEAPIVLLRRHRHGHSAVADEVAPGNPLLGVMLPYTPLHSLLLSDVGEAVVATSGNIADEPICIDEHEALVRLGGLADLFLVHNRLIVRHVDDSIARVQLGRELVLRRSRGYAPLPVLLGESAPPIVAVGAHVKNTIAVNVGELGFISQHIGDLETPEAVGAFTSAIASLEDLHGVARLRRADLYPGLRELAPCDFTRHPGHARPAPSRTHAVSGRRTARGCFWRRGTARGWGPTADLGGEFLLRRR